MTRPDFTAYVAGLELVEPVDLVALRAQLEARFPGEPFELYPGRDGVKIVWNPAAVPFIFAEKAMVRRG